MRLFTVTLLTLSFLSLPMYGNVIVTSAYAQGDECTDQDMKNIRSFNSKIKKMKNKQKKLDKEAESTRTIGGMTKNQRERQKVNDFFNSDEYNDMRPVYDRCRVSMPS